MRPAVVLLLALLPLPAWGQASADASANYALYLFGLRTAEMQAHLAYGPNGYSLDLHTRTTGVAQVLVQGEQSAQVRGGWGENAPAPRRYSTTGKWNGDVHNTTIEFSGGLPTVTVLVPPEKKEHLAIPPELLRDAFDSLSGFAAMVRQVARTARCEQHVHIFDGLHVLDVTAKTVGDETLSPDDQTSFGGRALRCDFEGRMIAGFTRGDETKQRRVLHATAWLARITPDGPPMPVKARFETRYFGDAVVMLVTPAASPPQ